MKRNSFNTIFKVKENAYKFDEDIILVRDHIGILSGKEEVFLNEKKIASHLSPFIDLKKYDHILIDEEVRGKHGRKFHLKVVCGMHLYFFPRAHIYINDKLVSGDISKPIYIPPVHWFLVVYMSALLGFCDLIVDNSFEIYSEYSINRESKVKVELDSEDLWQTDIYRVFDKSNKKLKKIKKAEWLKKCEELSNHQCRLVSYIFAIDGQTEKKLKYALRSCLNGFPLSCYHAYLTRTFTVSHPRYKETTDRLVEFCSKIGKFNYREKTVCRNFAKYYYKESGNIIFYKNVSGKLCDQGVDRSCYNLQAVMGEVIRYKD